MENKQAGEVALTWADNFIKGLLDESEKNQDVIKDLSTDAIRDTVRKLDVTSEEFRTGADILGERAFGDLYQASDVVYEHFDWAAWEIARRANKARAEADAETDEEDFKAKRATSLVLIEINADIDRVLDEVKKSNQGILGTIGGYFTEFFGDVDNLLESWLSELVSDSAVYLFSLPAMILFESFKNFFFEETE